jgi:hypothetical protein
LEYPWPASRTLLFPLKTKRLPPEWGGSLFVFKGCYEFLVNCP